MLAFFPLASNFHAKLSFKSDIDLLISLLASKQMSLFPKIRIKAPSVPTRDVFRHIFSSVGQLHSGSVQSSTYNHCSYVHKRDLNGPVRFGCLCGSWSDMPETDDEKCG